MPRFIVIQMLDHTTDEEAYEFVDQINETFQPHYDAYLAIAENMPDKN